MKKRNYWILPFMAIFLLGPMMSPDLAWARAMDSQPILVVPEKGSDFNLYTEKCQQSGYQCTINYFAKQIEETPTPLFDQLMDQIDFSSPAFVSRVENSIKEILTDEIIDLDQVEVLTTLLNQTYELSQKESALSLKKELDQLLKIEKAAPTSTNLETAAVLFKKTMALEDLKSMHRTLLKIPLIIINFEKWPEKVSLVNFKKYKSLNLEADPAIYLIDDACRAASKNNRLSQVNWIIFGKSCSLLDPVMKTTTSVKNFILDNKKILIGGAALGVGLFFFLKKYEVRLVF